MKKKTFVRILMTSKALKDFLVTKNHVFIYEILLLDKLTAQFL